MLLLAANLENEIREHARRIIRTNAAARCWTDGMRAEVRSLFPLINAETISAQSFSITPEDFRAPNTLQRSVTRPVGVVSFSSRSPARPSSSIGSMPGRGTAMIVSVEAGNPKD